MAAPTAPSRPLIYVSYSRRDRKLVEQMLTVLRERLGDVEIFYDVLIQPGDDFSDALARRLTDSSIVLFCLSPDSLNSRYCQREMETALAQAGKRVVPIVLKPCDWFSTPLATLRALPRDAKPVTTWRNRHEAFEDIARSLMAVVSARTAQAEPSAGTALPSRHTARVRRIAISPDGRRAVSASDDHNAIVWDLATMQPVAVTRHEGPVTEVAIDAESGMVATSAGTSITMWNLAGATPESGPLETGAPIVGMVWLQSGLIVADKSRLSIARGDADITLHPYEPASQLALRAGLSFTAIASSRDRRELLVGLSDGSGRWLGSSGQSGVMQVGPSAILEIHSLADSVRFAACAADTIQILTLGSLLRRFKVSPQLVAMAPMPDGKNVVVATVEGLRLIDLTTGAVLRDWPLPSDPPTAVATTPDGTRIVWGTESGLVSSRAVDATTQPLPSGEDRLRLAYLAVLELPELWPMLETLDESSLAGIGALLQLKPEEDVLQALRRKRPGVEPPALWMSWIATLYPSKAGKAPAPR